MHAIPKKGNVNVDKMGKPAIVFLIALISSLVRDHILFTLDIFSTNM